ncbi:TadE family protein [Comamonas composti]|uniref:TadE family protein n=1 Tax=Comamonas composti TaxID=408558 RepID=UPI0012EC9C2E|nr:TadE family protein [Comamonas composti]
MLRKKLSSGQATTEFLVCLLVLAPMFLGVYYLARYADVKHSAIQASRYVAFERAFDPYNKAKNASQLAQETQARFFLRRESGQQEIVYRDSPLKYQADKHRVPLWSDVGYKPLLKDFNDVAITERALGPLSSGLVGNLQQKVAEPVFDLPKSGIMKAEVTVSLAEITHFDALKGLQIGLPGATAIGVGAWNADGVNAVCSRVKRAVFGYYVEPVSKVLGAVMSPTFEKHAPDIGRVVPDYVPAGSLKNNAGQNVDYRNQDGSKC